MPVYAYRCPCCGYASEEMRCIAMRDNRLACAVCETPMNREISAVAGVVRDPAVQKKTRIKLKTTSFPSVKKQ